MRCGMTRREFIERSALAVATTHDLPTIRGWWRGLDIDLRQTLGVFDPARADRERGNRAAERGELAAALAAEGLLPTAEPPDEAPLEASVRYLARTASVLAGLQIEDVAGELNQANMPGVSDGHPNWRRRLSTDVEILTVLGGGLAKLAAMKTAAPEKLARSAAPVVVYFEKDRNQRNTDEQFALPARCIAQETERRAAISHVDEIEERRHHDRLTERKRSRDDELAQLIDQDDRRGRGDRGRGRRHPPRECGVLRRGRVHPSPRRR